MNVKCPQCHGNTIRGDLRSAVLSFGDFFIEHELGQKTFTGAPVPKPGVQRNNRVISFACTDCGLITQYLEKVIDAKG